MSMESKAHKQGSRNRVLDRL
ncbi:hypothetical protein OOU_Y34scaffold00312g3 [Pyricularia oryzae Y34]|uniref:Uncharacterized protein n=2 Tax=Pyricularia oryzae TaxID=318829 RepID=A0AA97PN82_PYRO3|nr:hypothetical protein OOU_Y34scaffold00312g3 [Pyricularia oryzae Y34]